MKTVIMKNIFFLSMALLLVSCDKFLDIQPTGKVIAKTGEEYRALLTGVYHNFPDDRSLTTLRTDELTLDKATITAEDYNAYFDMWTWNDVTPDEKSTTWSWRRFYHTVYIASYVIEKESEITDASDVSISQLVGEAYMFRAYTYSILVNLFGKPYTKCDPRTELAVPLMVVADVELVIGRSTVEMIYQQILSDIDMAKQKLNVDKWEEDMRYRFNAISADALLARVCLYMGRWQEALDAAKTVIEAYPELEDLTASGYTLPDNYTSKEAIVSLEQVMKSQYKGIGYPNADFISSITAGDLRKNRFFQAKTSQVYDLLKGGGNECRSTFRSAEFYLTAAEAAARLGNLDEAIGYMTTLIQKRYLAAVQTTTINSMKSKTQDELIDFILENRRVELCYEGHRWFDLRRTTQPRIDKKYGNETYTLVEGDSRYTMVLPREAISANPLLSSE